MIDIQVSTLPAIPAPRPVDSHKGDFGSVGILGGAPGMCGAALLAGRAALLGGAGRVYVGLLDARLGADLLMPELMLADPERLLLLPPPACLVCGPGLGQSAAARQWLEAALKVEHALLLDADALNLIAADDGLRARVRARNASTVVTPHPGEAARLLGLSAAEVQRDRQAAVQALAADLNAVAVLKGAGTLVLGAGSRLWRNPGGNPGMAAPGMGDVLAGLIAALVAQGLSAENAAVLGVWLHATAGDAAAMAGAGPIGLTASEVARHARAELNRLVTELARTV